MSAAEPPQQSTLLLWDVSCNSESNQYTPQRSEKQPLPYPPQTNHLNYLYNQYFFYNSFP